MIEGAPLNLNRFSFADYFRIPLLIPPSLRSKVSSVLLQNHHHSYEAFSEQKNTSKNSSKNVLIQKSIVLSDRFYKSIEFSNLFEFPIDRIFSYRNHSIAIWQVHRILQSNQSVDRNFQSI